MRLAAARRFHAALTLGAALTMVVALSACGSSSKSQSKTQATTPTVSVTETQLGPKSFAYQGLGSVSGGTVKITFTNAGKNSPHELQLARIDAGHSASEFKTVIVKLVTSNGHVALPSWIHVASGVGPIGPNQTATAIVKLPQGQYFAFDTQSPQGANNAPPYMTQGAFTSFQASNGLGGSLPTTAGKVVAKDQRGDKFSFVVSGLKAGPNAITFDNTSKELHHVLAVRLLPGHTAAQAKAAFLSNGPPKGPPPVDFNSINGTAIADSKSKQVNQITFAQPGNYILFCFLSDKDGKGKPHLERGLFKQVRVS